MVAEGAPEAAVRGRIRRHLEGWQLGLLAVALPVLALWLAIPRPVAPRRVPLPNVDRAELGRIRAADAERARAAAVEPLSFSVRSVGEAVRAHGAAGPRVDLGRLRAQLRARFRAVLAQGEREGLLRLRALQTQLFLAAVPRAAATGGIDPELRELAGDFELRARRAGWFTDGELVFTEDELFALYRIRWTEIVGALEEAAFRPTLQELRVYYRALLEHPEGGDTFEQDRRRLAYVGALERRDGAYPAALARGVLRYRLGQYAAAANDFMEHLAAHPEGPYALRARNHLLSALAASPGAE